MYFVHLINWNRVFLSSVSVVSAWANLRKNFWLGLHEIGGGGGAKQEFWEN